MARLLLPALLILAGCSPTLGNDAPRAADDDDAVDDDDAADDDDEPWDDDDEPWDDDDEPWDDDDDVDPEQLCGDLSDEGVLDLVYGGPKVPEGWWSETLEPDEGALWPFGSCANDPAETEVLSIDFYGATEAQLVGLSEDRWYYSADWAFADGFVMHIRQTRCDYWDGVLLLRGEAETWELEPLRELAGYLWWTQNHNTGGNHIATAFEFPGNATNFLSLCHVSTVYGDWGIRDEITVWQTDWSMLQFGGEGYMSGPTRVRVVAGNEN